MATYIDWAAAKKCLGLTRAAATFSWRRHACILCTALLVAACIPDTPKDTPDPPLSIVVETPEELIGEWMELAKDPVANELNPRTIEIVYRLSKGEGVPLMPILNVLADPNAEPYAKVFAVRSLADFMAPEYLPKLTELSATPFDGTTRACAVTLMGGVEDDEVKSLLRTATADEERRVRFAAMLGLVHHEDAETRAKLTGMYTEADTTARERFEIVRVLLGRPEPTDEAFWNVLVIDPDIDSTLRPQIAAVLGRIGGDAAVEPLRKSIRVAGDPSYSELAQAAMLAIQERAGGSADITTGH